MVISRRSSSLTTGSTYTGQSVEPHSALQQVGLEGSVATLTSVKLEQVHAEYDLCEAVRISSPRELLQCFAVRRRARSLKPSAHSSAFQTDLRRCWRQEGLNAWWSCFLTKIPNGGGGGYSYNDISAKDPGEEHEGQCVPTHAV